MKIGELAKRSGLTPSRIRFYESAGLMRGVERQDNGYREYGPDALWSLEIITGAQNAGFSLDEIRNLLPDAQDKWQHAEMIDSLKRKVAEIELMQQRLAQNKAQLQAAIEIITHRPEALPCVDRAQWVMDKLRET
ncbi:MAG: MerR family DNA-binding protein [Aquabacterium sp.]|uniref:MerR family transcriptional regulator n=1 Tax=Aquabacterium sp. TaxID=1872578 RepID=UPI0025BC8A1C|nr:MerR family transcriptional regulator [Aquabacterium sp.]MBI5924541.1 MerR family DNA-binding protein [Aquabacterium sp.]